MVGEVWKSLLQAVGGCAAIVLPVMAVCSKLFTFEAAVSVLLLSAVLFWPIGVAHVAAALSRRVKTCLQGGGV